MENEIYNDEFYNKRFAETQDSAAAILSILLQHINIESAVDIGCGVGAWLKTIENMGIHDVQGYDGDWVPLQYLAIEKNKFSTKDLSKPLLISRKFDLAICLEVAEHLPEEISECFIGELTSIAPFVLFSAAIPGQTGDGHINEQWPEYWVEKFRKNNYSFSDCVRLSLWDSGKTRWWYAQNTFLFINNNIKETLGTEIKNSLNIYKIPEKCVHPDCFSMISSRLQYQINMQNSDREKLIIENVKHILKLICRNDYILWGAGQHSEKLLSYWLAKEMRKPSFVVDDYSDKKEIQSIPVLKASEIPDKFKGWVILSSDQESIISKMRESCTKNGISTDRIIDLYCHEAKTIGR